MSEDLTDTATPDAPVFGEEDLRLYLGPEPAPYLAYWERMHDSGFSFVWSWNWWGALFPVPWLFYRKLWPVGAAVVLLPVLLDAMTGFGSKIGFIMAALVAANGKPLVVERAERKTKAVNALELTSQEAIDRLRRAGGVSLPGAVIGALLMFASLALALYDNLPLRLPGCTAPLIRDVVIDIAKDNDELGPLMVGKVTLTRVRQVGAGVDGRGRLCFAELRSEEHSVAIEYDVFWQSPSDRQFVVDLRRRD